MHTAVDRWKNEPSVAVVGIGGGAGTEPVYRCRLQLVEQERARLIPRRVLREFFDTAGAELRAIDPNTLITAGLRRGRSVRHCGWTTTST